MSVLGLTLCLATLPGHAGAWGADGHHATCLLAEVNTCLCFGISSETCILLSPDQ